jgi:hypothetical protein
MSGINREDKVYVYSTNIPNFALFLMGPQPFKLRKTI